MSKAAFGTEDRHLALRLQIVNFMAEYKSVFEMFCCDEDYEAYISKYDKKELGHPKLKFTQLQHFFKSNSVESGARDRSEVHRSNGGIAAKCAGGCEEV